VFRRDDVNDAWKRSPFRPGAIPFEAAAVRRLVMS
jgi:hypothetical protein